MQGVGEPSGLAAPRLAHGDEFFGWQVNGEVVSFGWVTYRDRTVGPVRLADASGRAFLFNFQTSMAYRGRGLYPALLLAMRSVLGHQGITELIIDVNVSNNASARGIEKAGFLPVEEISYLTIFNRWYYVLKRAALDMPAHVPQ